MQTYILGYAYKVTLFDSYEEADEARATAWAENDSIEAGGVSYHGGGFYVVWLSGKDGKEYYL